jgi:hypothetical protein
MTGSTADTYLEYVERNLPEGVSMKVSNIFFDFFNLFVSHLWCEHFYLLLSSRCDTEKGEEEGKRHWTDNKNEVSSCVA